MAGRYAESYAGQEWNIFRTRATLLSEDALFWIQLQFLHGKPVEDNQLTRPGAMPAHFRGIPS